MAYHFRRLLFLFLASNVGCVLAQTDSTEVEEDYSKYENMAVQEGSTQTYCTQKVFGQTPSRLL
ncbi:MAG: hypothetical protein ACKVTZ_22450, partial [Bacteroidia bacterium]